MRSGQTLSLVLLVAGVAACTSRDTGGSTRSLAQLDSAVRRLEESEPKWVLWRSPRSIGGFMPYLAWYPEDAFSARGDCRAAVQQVLDKSRAGGADTDDESSRLNGTLTVYRCLPESVDPRRQEAR